MLAKLTASGKTTSSEGLLGSLNKWFFDGIDTNANGVMEAMVYNDLLLNWICNCRYCHFNPLISPIIKKLMGDVH